MTDRPILFSAPMVRALLAGTKTQTRRVLKPQPFADRYYEGVIDCTFVPAPASNLQAYARFGAAAVGGGAIRTETFTPRIQPGDTVWVREAWRSHETYDDLAPGKMGGEEPVRYEADDAHQTWGFPAISKLGRLRASMHMPRWASRLTLTVTDVRVERLHDISEVDARAEGAYVGKASGRVADNQMAMNLGMWFANGRGWYADLWDRINAKNTKRAVPWASNPWVVAYSFTVEHRNIDAEG